MTRSETVGTIGGALAKAQAAMKPALKDAQNPHFKSSYADLASVWEACRAHLTAHGIAVVQSPEADGKRVAITTLLLHGSGEWVSGTLAMVARDDTPQSIGSAITYGRRYGLASMVGVAPDDDDGEAAQGRGKDAPRQPEVRRDSPAPAARLQAAPVNGSTHAGTGDDRLISEPQRKRFYAISKGKDWSAEDVTTLLQQHGYATSKDIRVRDYNALVALLEAGTLPEAPRDEDTSEQEYFGSEEAPF
jgi:hypothetical protein